MTNDKYGLSYPSRSASGHTTFLLEDDLTHENNVLTNIIKCDSF